jgi:hypothetical protein
METSTRQTADFAEMHGAMRAASGAVADGAGKQLFGG